MITKAALVVLITLFVIYLVLTVVLQVQQRSLSKLSSQSNEIKGQFADLQQYEELAARVSAYKSLIDSVTPQDPEAQSFLVAMSNINTSIISVESISMEDWFGARNCSITGSCAQMSDLEEYMNQVKAIPGVAGVSSQNEISVSDGVVSYNFVMVVSVMGSVTTTTTVATTATTTAAK